MDGSIADRADLVIGSRVHSLKEIPASKTLTASISPDGGLWLKDFVLQHANTFASVVQGRRQAFGRQSGRLDQPEQASIAASFGSNLEAQPNGTQFYQGNFIFPEGLDLSPMVARGGAVLLAWDAGNAPVEPIARFKPIRSQQNTLYRVLADR